MGCALEELRKAKPDFILSEKYEMKKIRRKIKRIRKRSPFISF